MSFLRTRLRALREPFGKAGLTVAILALVMAMVGGAYAAGGLTKSQEKQVTKIAKKYAGKPSAAGANGSPGAKGDAGAPGANGSPGANGVGVTGAPVSAGQEGCVAGGVKYTSASGANVVCNGKNGTNGTTGFTKTLPSNETETGSWSFSTDNEELLPVAIGFNIPLEAELAASKVHYVGPGHADAACPGSSAEPKANAGTLCVYQSASLGVALIATTETASVKIYKPAASLLKILTEPATVEGSGVSGALLMFSPEGTGTRVGWGSWAVTAE